MRSALKILEEQTLSRTGQKVTAITELAAGGNGRLFKLRLEDSVLVAKFYQRDNRDRLEREFQAFSFLKSRGFDVPTALFYNQEYYYGVYSFEPGQPKLATDLTKRDVDGIVKFILALENLSQDTGFPFPSAVNAHLSYSDHIDHITTRIGAVTEALRAGDLPPAAVDFINRTDVLSVMADLLKPSSLGITESEQDQKLPSRFIRLSPVDFGSHNMLFSEDSVRFVDFEYFGWDDPLRLIAEFIGHDRNQGLSDDHKQYFINSYLDGTKLPESITARLDSLSKLLEIEWLASHLQFTTPARLQSRAFADPNLDKDAFIDEQLSKEEKRLNRLLA